MARRVNEDSSPSCTAWSKFRAQGERRRAISPASICLAVALAVGANFSGRVIGAAQVGFLVAMWVSIVRENHRERLQPR